MVKTQISADDLRRGLRRLLVYVFALAAVGLALFVGLFRRGAVDALRLAEAAVAATVMVALTYFLVPCLLDGGCTRLRHHDHDAAGGAGGHAVRGGLGGTSHNPQGSLTCP